MGARRARAREPLCLPLARRARRPSPFSSLSSFSSNAPVLQAVQLPAGVTDLDACETGMGKGGRGWGERERSRGRACSAGGGGARKWGRGAAAGALARSWQAAPAGARLRTPPLPTPPGGSPGRSPSPSTRPPPGPRRGKGAWRRGEGAPPSNRRAFFLRRSPPPDGGRGEGKAKRLFASEAGWPASGGRRDPPRNKSANAVTQTGWWRAGAVRGRPASGRPGQGALRARMARSPPRPRQDKKDGGAFFCVGPLKPSPPLPRTGLADVDGDDLTHG